MGSFEHPVFLALFDGATGSLPVQTHELTNCDTSRDSGDDFLPEGREVLLDPADHYVVTPRRTVVLLARA